ncbi:transcriptional regulator [Pseudohoeflea suaedae]|uniref:Transcriptional regulator n=1 Tax=Pseudohoeflea suaedae TaxID=877384 RepID=A0A4R5PJQ3_9HYPH|nr:metalloregulator ArsR/SmtB family transcription factor [Pseudohoeflea suaedae]TDH35910.1 transcriptional regulator [Pseudohoeflea suaedae]
MKHHSAARSTCSDPDDQLLARQLAALSHPARLALLRCLGERDACCVKDLVGRVGLAQSTVSQHIRTLLDAGLVTYTPDRQASRYSLNSEALSAVAGSLDQIVQSVCSGCCGGKGRTGT